MTNFWLVVWAASLSLGWLLPNHYLPWASFHLEAWNALLLASAALAVILRTPDPATGSGIALMALLTATVPALQYVAGMYAFTGPAWIATAYLLGFFLAVMIGIRWESTTPGQMADGLFLAIGIAAICSVGLQLHQWLDLNLSSLFLWDMGDEGTRPFANFGQPNLLATFLIWGLLSVAWGFQRRHVSGTTTILFAVYLLFGIALTASRTAWIGITVLVLASWLARKHWRNRWVPWGVTLLGVCFFSFLHLKGWLQEQLLLNSPDELIRMTSEMRPQAWELFLDAVQRSPWFGYGWVQIAIAHTKTAINHPPLYILFSHSHNFFLDLILWNGIVYGIFLILGLLIWVWRRTFFIRNIEDIILLLLLITLGVHSMLEFPMSYTYFLFPAGLVIGALDVRTKARLWKFGSRWLLLPVWTLCILLLSLLARDYFRVETSYSILRYEFANIYAKGPKEPPQVLLLTQLREIIRFSRFEPHAGMSDEELNWMLNIAHLSPSAGVIHKLAAALAWNHRPEEARLWLRRMCLIVQPQQCEAVKRAWMYQGQNDPLIKAIPWPSEP